MKVQTQFTLYTAATGQIGNGCILKKSIVTAQCRYHSVEIDKEGMGNMQLDSTKEKTKKKVIAAEASVIEIPDSVANSSFPNSLKPQFQLAEDEEQFGFKIMFHGTGNRSYILGAESQESMEQWMKALACASYDYMKLMVAELQRQLDEMEECEAITAAINQSVTLRSHNKDGSEATQKKSPNSPMPPPRQRHNPFNRVQQSASLDGYQHHHHRSHSIRSAPGRPDGLARTTDNLPRTKVTFRELHTAYGRRFLSDFNAWKYAKRMEQEKKSDASQDLLITL